MESEKERKYWKNKEIDQGGRAGGVEGEREKEGERGREMSTEREERERDRRKKECTQCLL